MNNVFIHQNFCGQFLHMVHALSWPIYVSQAGTILCDGIELR